MKNAVVLLIVFLCSSMPAFAQAGQKPAGQKPAPSTRKPATAKPAPAAPAPAVKPTPPPPSDVRFKSRYTTGDQVTEGVTYLRGSRERYELGDMILLRQHDLKQTVQISVTARTYLITADAAAATDAPAGLATEMPKPPGLVNIETSIADIGERKPMFGQTARRVMTVIDRQPQPGACDQSKVRMETDAWYIDAPKTLAAQPPSPPPASAAACRDDIKATLTGDASLLGFPIAYATTAPGADGKPVVVMQMEVTEFEVTSLDSALFEIPEGMAAAASGRDLAKAVSDANEVQLATTQKAGPSAEAQSAKAEAKKKGVTRVGVPEVANKTDQNVDTRALRTQLIAELAEQKIEGVPLAAAPQAELDAYAKDLGADYLLVAQITELKASKPGRIGRMIKATAGESTTKDSTEAKLTIQLVPVGASKPRFSTNTSGNDGGIGFKTGLRLARVAAMMYLRYASPIGALNSMQMMNMGGMGGFLNNPMLAQMQAGPGVMGTGRGADRTAGAAMFLLDQAMSSSSDGAQDGPSFDASLAEAMQDGAKKVSDNLKR